MNKIPIVIIGAGPSGLCAAIESAKAGAKVLLIDENGKAGGQLFKQIHKFFGSKEHKAGTRGLNIGEELLYEAKELGIEVWLNTEVCGMDRNKRIWAIMNKKKYIDIWAEKVILASGAVENPVRFPGWTLPGVMGAGAAQTMININRVLPGKRVLMLGSGNVGVIVSYQLMQAGAQVVGIVEAAPRLGGYGVHTAKVCRAGVPFYTSHTISRALGENYVESAEIVELDQNWKPIEGTEKNFKVDNICIAAGLTPLTELAWIAGCNFVYIKELGGHVPIHDRHMETTVKGVYVAGDISGIEEASTAMEEGRLAGINAAASLGFYDKETQQKRTEAVWHRLDALRCGPFGQKRKNAKDQILSFREV